MTKNTTQPAIITHYQRVRSHSTHLCAPLLPEDVSAQPHPDVSPPKWHLGHTTWFFENFILREHVAGYELFDERLNWFFNSYYESQGPRISRSSRGNMTRPVFQRVLDYRKAVDEAMFALLRQGDPKVAELTELGLHHEQQHQELLLTDIKYILGNNPLYPAYREEAEPAHEAQALTFSRITGGVQQIGYDGDGFCWDNELSVHNILLEDFHMADRHVTNGEYQTFIDDGGYESFEHWQMEGIEWARTQGQGNVAYRHGQLSYRLAGGLSPTDPHAPVNHLSWYEADAYARWAGARLPTEFEWEVAQRQLGWQLPLQNWEWTNSAYLPYPRYPRPEGALGEYNGKFMINQMVLRGGSVATPAGHIRPTYRNFFQADKRWQFTGIRLAKDL